MAMYSETRADLNNPRKEIIDIEPMNERKNTLIVKKENTTMQIERENKNAKKKPESSAATRCLEKSLGSDVSMYRSSSRSKNLIDVLVKNQL